MNNWRVVVSYQRSHMDCPGTEALLTGQLATALEELKTKSEEPLRVTDIHAIKARWISKMLT